MEREVRMIPFVPIYLSFLLISMVFSYGCLEKDTITNEEVDMDPISFKDAKVVAQGLADERVPDAIMISCY